MSSEVQLQSLASIGCSDSNDSGTGLEGAEVKVTNWRRSKGVGKNKTACHALDLIAACLVIESFFARKFHDLLTSFLSVAG